MGCVSQNLNGNCDLVSTWVRTRVRDCRFTLRDHISGIRNTSERNRWVLCSKTNETQTCGQAQFLSEDAAAGCCQRRKRL